MEKLKSSVKNAYKANEEITFVHIEGYSNSELEQPISYRVDTRRLHNLELEKYHFQCKMNDFAEYRMMKMLWANVRETEDEDLKAILFEKIEDCKRVMGLY